MQPELGLEDLDVEAALWRGVLQVEEEEGNLGGLGDHVTKHARGDVAWREIFKSRNL